VASEGGQATRVPDRVADFMAQLPIDLLPIEWGKKVRLHGFGLHTMGRLASLPVGAVQAQFGPDGKLAWELANGIDRSRLLPHVQEESVSERLVFPAPATTLHAIVPAMEILLGRAFAHPTLRGRRARTASLEGKVLRKPPWTKHFAFKEAVGSKERALYALKGSLESVDLPGALEDMRLTLSGITGESGIQGGLFSDMRRQEQLRETMRQLEARLRVRPPIYQVRDVEPWSRIPERRRALVQFDP
jgi:DNA polymerase-4/protein ImuB